MPNEYKSSVDDLTTASIARGHFLTLVLEICSGSNSLQGFVMMQPECQLLMLDIGVSAPSFLKQIVGNYT